MADFFSKKEDKLPPLRDESRYDPKPVPAPAPQTENSVAAVISKIERVLATGGSVTVSGAKKEFMAAVSRFTNERNDGSLRISLEDGIITATNLKKNDTKL